MTAAPYDISVILPFADHEEIIGRAVKRLAGHLRAMEVRFEILCIDEDSGDNSHAVLGLLRAEIPELSLATAQGRGRGMAAGVAQARGAVLWMLCPEVAAQTLSPFGGFYRRVSAGELDVVSVDGRYCVCRRARVLDLVTGMRGGPGMYERLAKRASGRDLRVERHGDRRRGGAPRRPLDLLRSRPFARLLDAAPVRAALTWIDEV